jgi:heme-degrading monooxygenase HmoA
LAAGFGGARKIGGVAGTYLLRRKEKAMIAVIFEVWPADGQKKTYLDIAASLRSELATMDGFVSIERFQSLTDETKLLSLSFWRDEKAVAAWRNVEDHRAAQKGGREGVFRNYRLRIASVVRDYGMAERAEAPSDSRVVNG